MRIVMTGGGTGGHIYPALAIGKAVKEQHPDSQLLYIGTRRGLESRIVPQHGVAFEHIDITGFRRKISWENVRTLVRFYKGVKRSKELLRRFKPDVVVGTGGYVCGPVVYAAAKLGIPTLIHEQNVIPGLTNKFLRRYVSAVAVSFAESKQYFRPCPDVVHAGNPCSTAVLRANRSKGFASLGLPQDTPFVLVVGGSTGARAINEAIVEVVPMLEKLKSVHIVIVTGERFFEETEATIKKVLPIVSNRIHLIPYIHNMPEVLAATSLFVGRAGASFIAEITALGIPAILVPSPNVTNNHQEANAKSLVDAGAAKMILERDLSGSTLFNELSDIVENTSRHNQMAKASLTLGMPNAAQTILDQIHRIVR
ncbi:MAG: undecaprenyldiphospho-muramoylpentapeptide beta-N-acetylglucosaminyltransferase [Candidatus Cohnella colombiensis]|uniref:UDP-N-acetylglucosamine--N-acetylmuramyl-(pentapeptide) pyrophosphoryl-undecaprenol N-acetylglucosamine transferase n=1 Tax=Candidatus Cohnella colombiensis TaxID=3121368 RepID=A0AA95EXA9_9BACL|nr:MAG: undecaprenyldiphospho-muramoylpentapeptide beta-N-acetylglucosaminyltransferase [Cohnella sp.]